MKMGLEAGLRIWRSIGRPGRRWSVANPRKRSSLSDAFGDVPSRTTAEGSGTATPVGESKRHKPETGESEMVPAKGGRLVAANTPVNMTFTVSAKERYEWSLELKRRGLSAVSVLREAMNELLRDGKE
jgi:hypothetical protein